MPRHRDPTARVGCAARTAGVAGVAALAVISVGVAVALATGPAQADPAEPPRRAEVCAWNGSGGRDCTDVSLVGRTWTPPADRRG